jgi:hypothetical protein
VLAVASGLEVYDGVFSIGAGTGRMEYYEVLPIVARKPWLQDLIREHWNEIVMVTERRGGRFLDSDVDTE